MEIVIPCAGEGSRFTAKGYTTIKQLLDLNGRPVLSYLVDNFRCPHARFTFLFQKKHLAIHRAEIERVLDAEDIEYQLIEVDGRTDGAVSTSLLAMTHVDLNDELIIANSDQYIDWNIQSFLDYVRHHDAVGAMPIFINTARENKWSFVSMDESGISAVRAKDPFTPYAVVGIYYFRTGADFYLYSTRMIAADKRVNGEFYVCPVYNEVLADDGTVLPYMIDHMIGLGTPEDYEQAKMTIYESNPLVTKRKRPRRVEKQWGYELWFANNEEDNYCGKILHINAGAKFSMHFHRMKAETFYLMSGSVILRSVDYKTGLQQSITLNPGDAFTVPREFPHQIEALNADVTLIEASTFHRDSDSYRLWR